MEKFFSLWLIGFTALAVSACGFRKEKPPKEDFSTLSTDPSKVSYQMVHRRVLAPKCISCHGTSGGVNLESYPAVKQHLAGVERTALRDKTMPKNGSLSSAEAALLEAWIKAGAPENPGVGGPDPEPTPPPNQDPLEPTFVSIRKNIFDNRCMSCHSAGGQASGVPLQTLKDLIDSPRELVLPGNPTESGLYIAVTRSDSKRMPPGGSLADDEIAVIKKWIEIGAPQGRGSPPTPPRREDPETPPVDPRTISYSVVRTQVFEPRCLSCHATGGRANPKLESYEAVKENLNKIIMTTLVEKTMPKGGGLSKKEMAYLIAWINAGTPEKPPGEEPDEPLKPTFTSLKKKVFGVRCMTCHSGDEPSGDVSFDSLAALKASPREPLKMEDEGDPDTSGLVITITREDSKRMPPPDNNEPALSKLEIDAIRKWIKDGAPE